MKNDFGTKEFVMHGDSSLRLLGNECAGLLAYLLAYFLLVDFKDPPKISFLVITFIEAVPLCKFANNNNNDIEQTTSIDNGEIQPHDNGRNNGSGGTSREQRVLSVFNYIDTKEYQSIGIFSTLFNGIIYPGIFIFTEKQSDFLYFQSFVIVGHIISFLCVPRKKTYWAGIEGCRCAIFICFITIHYGLIPVKIWGHSDPTLGILVFFPAMGFCHGYISERINIINLNKKLLVSHQIVALLISLLVVNLFTPN